MVKVTIDQMRQRFESVEAQRHFYEWKSKQPGKLELHEKWRHTYLSHPYLIGSPQDRVAERFQNIFINSMELNSQGKISPIPISETDEHMQAFTHMLEEYGLRCGQPPESVNIAARAPIFKYFEHGTPIGIKLFESYKTPQSPILVKYGKRKFLEPMFQKGDLRLANASFYNDSQLLNAVRDNETSRTFFIPTYKERLAGVTHCEFQGKRIEYDDDDIVLPLVFGDYYLFSLCEHIHYRMPTDFEADSAIVIRDPIRFKQRLISTFLAYFSDWEPLEGKVIYYDPYRDYSKFKIPEMAKHFGYAYQKEVRVAFRPRFRLTTPLKPLHLSIGPMSEYADLLCV